MSAHEIRVTINGEAHCDVVESRVHLADYLRRQKGLTGVHLGCEHGVCGACTVLVDGASMRSCLTFAVQADGKHVRTVEGLAPRDGGLHALQALFARHHALQCGFCTPGVLMTIIEMKEEAAGEAWSETRVREALSGNLCRCTGYQGMVEAALEYLQSHETPADGATESR
ncbi:MAG: (2Fe-2S)-binding protein [Beijerinckiaceae bacterium]|jgi:carbon-monoxide dehydrogenase small subunit